MRTRFYFVSHIGQSNDLKAEDATLQEQAFKATDAQGRNNRTTNGASSSGASNTSNTKVEEIYVDIKGAVKHPNIYRMMSTDRLKQLLDKAQPTSQADLTQINLAERLTDQNSSLFQRKGTKPLVLVARHREQPLLQVRRQVQRVAIHLWINKSILIPPRKVICNRYLE